MTTILVTGATGNVGSRAVRELRARGAAVRAFVRDPAKAARLLDDGVDVAAGTFDDAESVRRAMQGIDGVLLSSGNDPRQAEHEAAVVDAAAQAGVTRLVKLSTIGARPGAPVAFLDAHGRAEEHVRRAIPSAVVLRSSYYMSNTLAFADQVRAVGRFFSPADGACIAMVDPRDVAAVAAAVLTAVGHDGETLELTGPEAITLARVAEELSAVTGRPIEFVAVPDDAAQRGMTEAGLPEWVASNVVRLYGELRRGLAARTTSTVRRVTGREPGTYAQFARAHAAAFGGA